MKCPDCDSENTRSIGALETRNSFAGINVEPLSCQLYICKSCYINFRAPRWSSSKILDLYAAAEIKVWEQSAPPTPWLAIYAYLAECEPESILDFGCFAGDFLHFMPQNCKKFGIEPSIDANKAAQARGITILGKTISDLDVQARFDVITLLDVIEHVEQPSLLMKSLSERLNPWGRIIVLTGANDSFWFKLFAPRYWYCSISEHLVFISKKWSILFSEKHNLNLVRYDLITYHPKPAKTTILETVRALIYAFIVPSLIRLPRLTKMIGLGKFLLWKNAPTTLSCRDHVIAVFQKKHAP